MKLKGPALLALSLSAALYFIRQAQRTSYSIQATTKKLQNK